MPSAVTPSTSLYYHTTFFPYSNGCGQSGCGCVWEPLKRFELSTSSLPRKCSTPELQRHTCSFCGHSMRVGVGTSRCVRGQKWSGGRDSNSRHSAWKADALPTELPPLIKQEIIEGEYYENIQENFFSTIFFASSRSSTS